MKRHEQGHERPNVSVFSPSSSRAQAVAPCARMSVPLCGPIGAAPRFPAELHVQRRQRGAVEDVHHVHIRAVVALPCIHRYGEVQRPLLFELYTSSRSTGPSTPLSNAVVRTLM